MTFAVVFIRTATGKNLIGQCGVNTTAIITHFDNQILTRVDNQQGDDFVPGTNAAMLSNAFIYSPDAIMFDLEDSVSIREKDRPHADFLHLATSSLSGH